MDGLPVTIRLLDPPLHEFVPHDEKGQQELANELGVDALRRSRLALIRCMNSIPCWATADAA